MRMRMIEFERPLFDGINFISASIICNFTKDRDVWIIVGHPSYDPIDGLVLGGSASIDRPESVAHLMKLPDSFMERAAAYSTKVYEPHSVFNMLRDRLRSQSGAQGDKGEQ